MRLRDIIYPPRCICCYSVVENNRLTCSECEKKLKDSVNYVDYHTPNFDCTSLYKYNECTKGAVGNIKWKRSITICKKIGSLLADEAEKLHSKTPFDLVAYVPMTKRDKGNRGFNQCEVMAKVISKRLDLKFERNVLKKIRQTKPQKELTAAERAKNLKGAFKVCKDVEGKNVLLIDDVITTGSTLKENAKMLYKAGTNSVTVCTFAKV